MFALCVMFCMFFWGGDGLLVAVLFSVCVRLLFFFLLGGLFMFVLCCCMCLFFVSFFFCLSVVCFDLRVCY